ncbi:MAG: ABC transporter permease [Verrucomicrobiales bacterium]|nr:ABC transporter permease [Verrucomicrobiales bacterium]
MGAHPEFNDLEDRRRRRAWWLFCGPGLMWLVVFVYLPLAFILGAGFLTRGDEGQMGLPWTLDNYRRLAGWTELGFDPLYPVVLGRTLALAAAVTTATLAASVPLAFFMASRSGGWRAVALGLVVVPFWTNLLVRTYAWQILLGGDGWLAHGFAAVGLVASGEALYPGWMAVFLGMFCDFLPFMVLPVFASVERIDPSLAEAAADLGASGWRIFRHAILPQIAPGLGAGAVMVFLPALGQFVIPDLLGGGRTTLLGNLIQQQFGASRDWPFGAALSVSALAVLALATLGVGRKGRWAQAGELES